MGDRVTPGDVQVAALDDVSVLLASRRWSARAEVLVHNESGPAASASVNAQWSGGAKGSSSCTTGANGRCLLSKNVKLTVDSATIIVTGISFGGVNYPPGALSSLMLTQP